jgi:small subunit ribosomal protein S18
MAEKRKYTKKHCKYTASKVEYIDYKKPNTFKYSLSERYKIMPRRLTGTAKKYQDMVEIAVKRARHMAIIPYIVDRKDVVENPFDQIEEARRHTK